ncbi:PREDICTED: 60S acidic ribosomal protein P1-like [Elephantulus edwardii]|uniref:60S acidic ribosomal protein P1-like n=1 Tax=Elephantulus edwardii TaxID=28737 RepID=UPI0003F0EC54|nr:PREDICTED: 60S acidic ribosomal protein P1-like [Elephantulus edwardii]
MTPRVTAISLVPPHPNPNSELGCIYSVLILHNDEVTITDDKISVLIKTADVSIKPFLPGLFANSLANVNTGSLCNVDASGPAPVAQAALAGGPAPSYGAAPAKKKVEAKKEDSEESDNDMGFGLND